jgi:cell division inhibitor SepF
MSKFFKKTLSFLGLDEDGDDYDREDFNDGEAGGSDALMKDKGRMGKKYQQNSFEEKNVVRFKPERKKRFARGVKDEKSSRVSIAEPHEFEDVQSIGDDFKKEVPVIVNLQNTNPDLSKRVIDFCSGLTYALEGSIEKVANKVFLITPYNVTVTSKEKES